MPEFIHIFSFVAATLLASSIALVAYGAYELCMHVGVAFFDWFDSL